MPFQSDKQRRYLWANEPEIARDWTDRYGANQGGIMRVPFYEGTVIEDPLYQGLGHNLGDTLSSIGTSVSDALITPLGSATTEEGLPSIDITGKPQSRFDTPDFSADIGNTNFFGQPVVDDEVVSRSFKDHKTLASWLAANPQMGETITRKAKEFFEGGKELYETGKEKIGTGAKWLKNAAMTGIGKAINFPIGLISGAASFRNPLNQKSANYNWDLAGQIKNLNTRGMLGDQSSPYKITSGPLRGKNLVSGFGTNDYSQMLQKRIDYFNKQKAKKGKLFTDEQDRRLREAEDAKRIADAQAAARATQQVRQNIQTYGDRDRPDTGMNAPGGGRGQSPTGGNVAGTPFAHGGLAGLWHRK